MYVCVCLFVFSLIGHIIEYSCDFNDYIFIDYVKIMKWNHDSAIEICIFLNRNFHSFWSHKLTMFGIQTIFLFFACCSLFKFDNFFSTFHLHQFKICYENVMKSLLNLLWFYSMCTTINWFVFCIFVLVLMLLLLLPL